MGDHKESYKTKESVLKGKRILFLIYGNFFHDPRSQKSVAWLTNEGAHVTVVTTAPAIPKDYEQPGCDVELIGISGYKESHCPFRPIRILLNLTYCKAYNVMVNWRSRKQMNDFLCDMYLEKIARIKPDLIYVVNAYTLKPAGLAKQTKGIPFVYDAQEFWPTHRIDKVNSLSNAQRKNIELFEKEYLPDASAVITVGEYLAQEYAKEYDLPPVHVIYNAPLHGVSHTSPCHQPVRLLFQGNLNPERNVEGLLRAMPDVKNAVLTFQGRGVHEGRLRSLIRELGLGDRVEIVPPVPYDKVSEAASKHDIGIVCHKAYDRQMEGAMPNKFFDGLSGGLAMAASNTRGFQMLRGVEGAMALLDPSTPCTLARDLNLLTEDPDRVTQMKGRALECSRSFSGQAQAGVLVGIISPILM